VSELALPSTWSLVRIGEITEPIEKALPAKAPKKEIRYLDISGIDNKSHRVVDAKTYLGATAPSRARQLVQEDDILFSTVRTYLKNIAKVPAEYDGQIASTGFSVLRASSAILPDYLFAFALTPLLLEPLASLQRGSNYPAVRDQDVRSQSIPLPPLAEQKRIVAKIEELFSELEAGEESLRVARRQLGVYRQSLLKQAFEGKLTAKWRTLNSAKLEAPAQLLARIQSARQSRYEQEIKEWERDLKKWEKSSQAEKRPAKPRKPHDVQLPSTDQVENLSELPKAWSWISVANCAVEISDGPFGSNLKSDDYVSAGVRVVRLENIGAGEFIEEKESFISSEKYEKLKRHTVRPGDIVVASFINDAVRAALIPESIEYAVNKADCFQVHCFGETISADFLVRCFGARYFFKQLEQLVHGVGRPRINTTQLGEAFVPLCSLPEQQEIVRLLDEQFEVIGRNEREIDGALRRSEVLRQSILHRAFTGRLVPRSPSDEPAATLLARLHAEAPVRRGKSSNFREFIQTR
jgi:type I restriction enzyme S subunit